MRSIAYDRKLDGEDPMAVGAAPFGEMPSTLEILRRVRALIPEAGQNETDQHVVSQVILKQFTEPWRQKRETAAS